MDSDRILIAALLFIAIVVGANFIMYGIARGAARGGNTRWMSALRDSLSKPMRENHANQSMDELRTRVQELEKKKPEQGSDRDR